MAVRTGRILLERIPDEPISIITLNRPDKLNALEHSMTQELDDVLREADADPETACIIFTGAGDRAFCAGFDLNEMLTWGRREWLEMMYRQEPWVYRWATVTKPTIAAVNGYAHGAGAILASSCDFRIGCEDSSFRFTAASGGAVNNTWFLPLIVGMTKAKELIYTAETMSADDCNAAGFFTRYVAKDEVLPTAVDFARSIVKNPMPGLVWSKRLLRESVGRSFYDAYTAENAAMGWEVSLSDPADNAHIAEWQEHISQKAQGSTA